MRCEGWDYDLRIMDFVRCPNKGATVKPHKDPAIKLNVCPDHSWPVKLIPEKKGDRSP